MLQHAIAAPFEIDLRDEELTVQYAGEKKSAESQDDTFYAKKNALHSPLHSGDPCGAPLRAPSGRPYWTWRLRTTPRGSLSLFGGWEAAKRLKFTTREVSAKIQSPVQVGHPFRAGVNTAGSEFGSSGLYATRVAGYTVLDAAGRSICAGCVS